MLAAKTRRTQNCYFKKKLLVEKFYHRCGRFDDIGNRARRSNARRPFQNPPTLKEAARLAGISSPGAACKIM